MVIRAKPGDDREEQNEDGDELDTLEIDEVELKGEADGDNGGCVDDEPSLGSLDGRFSQLRWGGTDRCVHLAGRRFRTRRTRTRSRYRGYAARRGRFGRTVICWGGFWAVPLVWGLFCQAVSERGTLS